MTVTTRPATPADAAAIQRLNRDDLGYDHPLDAVVAALVDALASPRDLVMVAEVDGDVVGYVHAEEHRLLYLDLLVKQVTNPVRWDLCQKQLLDMRVTGLLELVPGGTLTGLAKRSMKGVETLALKSADDLEAARTFAQNHAQA